MSKLVNAISKYLLTTIIVIVGMVFEKATREYM